MMNRRRKRQYIYTHTYYIHLCEERKKKGACVCVKLRIKKNEFNWILIKINQLEFIIMKERKKEKFKLISSR